MQENNHSRIADKPDTALPQQAGQAPVAVDETSTASTPNKRKLTFTAILSSPIAIVVIAVVIVSVLALYAFSQDRELGRLEEETTNLLSSSNLTRVKYDCRDAEFQSACYFTFSEGDPEVGSFLRSQGFSETTVHGNGYQKDNFYVRKSGKNSYSSFFVEQTP